MRRRRVLSIATTIAAVAAGVGVGAPGATAASTAERPHFVQLGDSYSSGNGAGAYEETTCWRSPNNYGTRVAKRQGATYTNAACGGGVIADVLEPREIGSAKWPTRTYRLESGTNDARTQWLRQARRDELCGTPEQPDWHYDYTISSSAGVGSLYTATVKCQLVAAPQIDAVTPDTDAVFITVGGNDIGFVTIATNCLVLRTAVGCKSAMDAANAQIPEMKRRTKDALRAVHARSGGRADVYLLGYPHLINTDSYKISPTYDAGAALDALQKRGDRVQRAAMTELDRETGGRGGFTFVDVKPDWDGYTHGLDPRVVADNSNAWLVPALGLGSQFSEWVHPSPAGWGASALALYAAMD